MSTKIFTYLMTLLVGLGLGFFLGKNTAVQANNTPPSIANIEPEKKLIADSQPIESTTSPIDTTAIKATGSDTKKEPSTSADTEEAETSNASPPVTINNTLPSDGACYTEEKEFSLQLTLFAEDMERQKLMYDKENPARLQDCSGIFHRVVKFVKSKCDNYTYPDPAVARDSRSLAKWYHSQNNLVIIDDPKAKANLIKPGSVMFFGSSGKKYPPNLTVDQLASHDPKGIEHIGVVTEVKRDEAGNVTGYVMFHGRRPTVHAQRSHYHGLKPPRLGYPILGNWEQEWLAIANIMTPK